MPITIEIPYVATEGDDQGFNRRKVEARRRHGIRSDTHFLTLRRVAKAAKAAGVTLESGQAVTRPEDVVALICERIEAAAEEA